MVTHPLRDEFGLMPALDTLHASHAILLITDAFHPRLSLLGNRPIHCWLHVPLCVRTSRTPTWLAATDAVPNGVNTDGRLPPPWGPPSTLISVEYLLDSNSDLDIVYLETYLVGVVSSCMRGCVHT